MGGARLLVEQARGNGTTAEAAVGEIGEVVVESPALALGYGTDDAPAHRFRRGSCPSCRRYATGDRGRRLADGSVEILGRADDEVSIASHRVSLSAVSALVRREFAVHDVVTLLVDNGAADIPPRLATWVVPAGGAVIDSVAVRQRLRRVAAPELVPQVVLIVEEIPRDANGKPDRRALTVPAATAASELTNVEGAGAATVADVVAAAYGEVLGLHSVPHDANFFDLGGSSLAMTRVLHRLETALSRPLSALTLFEFPSVATLTATLMDQSATRTAPRRPMPTAATRDADRRAALRHAIRQGVPT